MAVKMRPIIRLPPAPRALIAFPEAILGLAPQALCWRPLRGLRNEILRCTAMQTAPA